MSRIIFNDRLVGAVRAVHLRGAERAGVQHQGLHRGARRQLPDHARDAVRTDGHLATVAALIDRIDAMALALPEAGRYFARSLKQSLRLMVGLPDYDVYLTHMAATHPDRPPMSYEALLSASGWRRATARARRCC